MIVWEAPICHAPFKELTALSYARAIIVLITYLALLDHKAQTPDEFASDYDYTGDLRAEYAKNVRVFGTGP